MKGSCLCQTVQFEITNEIPNLYQCHCSLCQKATGTASTFSFITSPDNIKWISGQDNIHSYTNENGFRTDFCKSCGSPTPNIMSFGHYLWAPAGLLEGETGSQVAAHIYLNSKASWENQKIPCLSLAEGPDDIKQFINTLNNILD